MAEVKTVKRDLLKEAVNIQLPIKAPNDEIVLVGCRKVNGGKYELEFAQARQLRSSKTDVAAILNESDERFSTNSKVIFRNWMSVEKDDVMKAFKVDLSAHFEAADKAASDERVIVMMSMKTIYVGDVPRRLNIRVVETVDINSLPKNIRENIEANNEYSENTELKAFNSVTNKLENVVDAEGNIVYRYTKLDHIGDGESIDDVLVPGKMIASRYLANQGKDTSGVKTKKLNLESVAQESKIDLNI